MFLPVVTTDLDNAFGCYGTALKKLLPPEPVPEEFYHRHNPWAKIVAMWFFEGLSKGTVFIAKEGIRGEDVFRHVGAILRSWEPKHEDKEATCAYLLSLWLERVEFPVVVKETDDEPKH